MNNKDLQKSINLEDLGNFTEEVLLPGMDRLIRENKTLATKNDLKKFATKDDLKKMETRLVTKDYLDKKLFALEEKIIDRVLREKSKLKDALILVMGIIKSDKKPTKKQIETLKFLEQDLIKM